MKTMKENWICPDVQVQEFAPQEYVNACYEQVSTLPPGDYRIGWCIRDATGSNLESAQTEDGSRTGYFLQAPSGFEAGKNILDLVQDTQNSAGNTVVCTHYPNYQWYDSRQSGNAGSGSLTKGDQIIYDGKSFTLDGSSYSTLAVPSSAIFSVTGHS